MNPISFPEQTIVLAKDQPQYLPLPVWQDSQQTISCWRLSLIERFKLIISGKLWIRQLNFNESLQPQLPQINNPFKS